MEGGRKESGRRGRKVEGGDGKWKEGRERFGRGRKVEGKEGGSWEEEGGKRKEGRGRREEERGKRKEGRGRRGGRRGSGRKRFGKGEDPSLFLSDFFSGVIYTPVRSDYHTLLPNALSFPVPSMQLEIRLRRS